MQIVVPLVAKIIAMDVPMGVVVAVLILVQVVALEAAQLDVLDVLEGVLTPVNMVASGVPRKFL